MDLNIKEDSLSSINKWRGGGTGFRHGFPGCHLCFSALLSPLCCFESWVYPQLAFLPDCKTAANSKPAFLISSFESLFRKATLITMVRRGENCSLIRLLQTNLYTPADWLIPGLWANHNGKEWCHPNWFRPITPGVQSEVTSGAASQWRMAGELHVLRCPGVGTGLT